MTLHSDRRRVPKRPVDMSTETWGPQLVRREPGDEFKTDAGRFYIRRSYGCLVALPDVDACRLYLAQRRQAVRLSIIMVRNARRYGEHPRWRGSALSALGLAVRDYRTAWRSLNEARALHAAARAIEAAGRAPAAAE